MIVNWTKDCVKVIESRKLGKTIVLLPGHNIIDSKVWEAISKESGLDSGYEAQFLKVITDKIEVKEGTTTKEKEVKEFKDMKPDTSKAIIDDMFNIKDLNELLKNETRADIRLNIEQRINELKEEKNNKRISNRNEK